MTHWLRTDFGAVDSNPLISSLGGCWSQVIVVLTMKKTLFSAKHISLSDAYPERSPKMPLWPHSSNLGTFKNGFIPLILIWGYDIEQSTSRTEEIDALKWSHKCQSESWATFSCKSNGDILSRKCVLMLWSWINEWGSSNTKNFRPLLRLIWSMQHRPRLQNSTLRICTKFFHIGAWRKWKSVAFLIF